MFYFFKYSIVLYRNQQALYLYNRLAHQAWYHCKENNKIMLILFIFFNLLIIKKDSFKIYCEARKMAWDNQFTQQTKDIFSEVEKLYQGVDQQDFLSMAKKNIYTRSSNPIP